MDNENPNTTEFQISELDELLTNEADSDIDGQDAEVVEQSQITTGEMCSSLLMIGFSLLSSTRGKHWELSHGEAIETGNAIGAVLDKYFPDMSNNGVEIAAAMTGLMVLAPRISKDRANSKLIDAANVNKEKTVDREVKEESTSQTLRESSHGDK